MHLDFSRILTRRAAVYALAIPLITLYGLLLGGCTSKAPVIRDLHLLKLRSPNSDLEARIGFFGICAHSSTSFRCDYRSIIESDTNFQGTLFELALNLQEYAFLPVLTGAAVVFAVGVTFYFVVIYVINRGYGVLYGTWQTVVFGLLWLNLVLSIVSATAVHMAATGIVQVGNGMGSGDVVVKKGKVAEGVLWSIVGLSFVFTAALGWVVQARQGG